jgi:Fic family protein
MSEFPTRQEIIYNKNTPLERVFHNATSRILDYLILNPKFDYSASQISEVTRIPLRTVHRVLPHIVETKLVKETGRVGNMKMYMLNPQSELAGILKDYVHTSLNLNLEEAKKITA